MANKMLIDATHPEETRVVVLRGNRVEEFDFESALRKQLRGNIYLAKVTRVEPSLQAAFVDYGGNRHGFLAFSEIHPDYYQIPVADRQALIDEEGRAQRAADDEADRRSRRRRHHPNRPSARRDDVVRGEPTDADANDSVPTAAPADGDAAPATAASGDEAAMDHEAAPISAQPAAMTEAATDADTASPAAESPHDENQFREGNADAAQPESAAAADDDIAEHETAGPEGGEPVAATNGDDDGGAAGETRAAAPAAAGDDNGEDEDAAEEMVESVGGADALEEVPDRAPRYRRQYKIQEVIKRRQVMLVQVVKEERGTKGAALTTYLSLAGRYSVLMPNTARGGGISRKITSGEDRSRLKEVAEELEVPEGMGVILRTAGANRTKTEIKRDFEYLLRMWETVRDLTLKSTAPKLVYEEGSLVKRSIRDLYSKDIDEIIVAGTDGYHEAKDFMRMLMPSHAKNVKLYSDTQPLLSRYGVENQLDAMFSPVVQLRSGGYIVLNQAEALVAIDVNSGRATREHHIEDTALKTNMEAADEVARQLRLRDLAGLIVIDFIDMDEKRNNRSVERRLKESLKHDRARIQVGRISHFGLLEMSRQRIRTGVLESSTEKCPYCGGSGHVRSVSSLALQVLRALEEHLIKGSTHNLIARTRPDVALYVLNQKRAHLRALEERFVITITVISDETVAAPQAFVIERGEQVHTVEAARAIAEQNKAIAAPLEEEDELEEPAIVEGEDVEAETAEPGPADEQQAEAGGRRRRRRRRRGGRDNGEHGERDQPAAHAAAAPFNGGGDDGAEEHAGEDEGDEEHGEPAHADAAEHHGHGEGEEARRDGERRRRRRGRRGGRRNRHDRERGGEPGSARHDDEAPASEHSFGADETDRPAAPGSNVNEAGADLDTAPSHMSPAPEPAAVSDNPAAPSAPTHIVAEPEPPRRRSTVREPAPVSGTDTPPAPVPTPSPAPEPVITEVGEADTPDRPRRSGWWSRRSAGG